MKIEREDVLYEHMDGSPHITRDEQGVHHHHGKPGVCAHRATDGFLTGDGYMVEVSVPEALAGRGVAHRVPLFRQATHAGPARVTSDAYRDGWDAIWARPRGQA